MFMRRLALSFFAVFGIAAMSGCPGALNDPGSFEDAAQCAGTDIEELFLTSCGDGNCHDDVDPAEQLDLISPNVESRLVGVNSVAPGCQNQVLVVAGAPASSYFLAKVEGTGLCGLKMPLGALIDPRDVDCISQWIETLEDPPSMGIPDEGSPDGGSP